MEQHAIHPSEPRPLKRRFHPEGSEASRALVDLQCEELGQLVESGDYEQVLRRLGHDSLATLAGKLEPQHLYALGHAAHQRQRHDLAQPLLEAAVAAGEKAGDLLPWAQLFASLTLRALGELAEARPKLEAITAEGDQTESSPALSATAFHAGVALAWLHLGEGERSAAMDCLQVLRRSPLCGENASEVDLLGRVLSTLEWLESNPREQLNHAIDRAQDCAFVAAIDAIRISPCGTLLQIEGWVVDPGVQLRELCLVRGDRVWRLNLEEASYSSRPDLNDVVQRCHATSELHPGLRLQLVAMPEERVPLEPGEAADLFVVLNNGVQFCLRRSLQGTPLRTDQLKQVVDAAIAHPTRLQAPMLLQRVRDAWSQQLLAKMEQPAEHQCHSRAEQATPELSVVVPLYGRVDFMEYQLNWFNAWRRRHGDQVPAIQLIYVLDDPRLKQEFNALVKRCHTLYSVPFETVINPDNMGFAGANNRGAQLAKAPLLLLLNSDVLPAHDSSLELMLRAMQQHGDALGALGARLLFDNGAIQHCGMEFVTEPDLEGDLSWVWLNEHPLKGVNSGYGHRQQLELQEVEAATAACLMLRTDLYRQLQGLSSQYVVGDFEDSDLCLQIRSLGLPIAVDLAAVFHHLERQSVGLGEENNSLKAKIVTANAITHHQRWCSAIERMKRSQITTP
ncbi:glycosyltransferase [Synechococcus sp. CCY9202]|nr:glycosyltransferase [Synechococcus sp. CCY9202]